MADSRIPQSVKVLGMITALIAIVGASVVYKAYLREKSVDDLIHAVKSPAWPEWNDQSLIRTMTGDPNSDVARCCDAVQRAGGEELAVAELEALTRDSRKVVRDRACFAICQFIPATPSAIAVIVKALSGPREEVRRSARWAIEDVGCLDSIVAHADDRTVFHESYDADAEDN